MDEDRAQAQDFVERLSGVGSWRADLATGAWEASPELLRIMGTDTAPTSCEALLSLVREEDRDRLASRLGRRRGSAEGFEERVRLVVGEGTRWFEIRGEEQPDHVGERTLLRGIMRDIAEEIAAQEHAAVRDRIERLLRSVTETILDSSQVDDLIAELTRIGVADPERWTRCESYVVGDDLALRLHSEAGADRAPELPHARELATLVLREGAPRWACDDHRFAFPVRAEGDIALIFVLDRAEGPVSRPQADLAAAQVAEIAGRTIERLRIAAALQEARDEAMRASAAKSAFLSAMTREVRVPVTAMVEASEQLLAGGLSTRQRELCLASVETGQQLGTLIDDVLDLTALEAGRLRLREDDFELGELCDELTTALAGEARSTGNDLLVHVDPSAPAVLRGDAARVGQILRHLVVNALTHTRDGAVCVSVRAVPAGRRTRVIADVVDDGEGIAASDLERIFEPFVQSPAAVHGARRGAGLGLALSRRLAAAMGGVITAESTPDQGSTFTVELLLGPPRGSRTSAVDDVTRARLADRRALIVSDSQAVSRALAEILRGWDARVESCGSSAAHAAMRAAIDADDAFDAAVWDVQANDLADPALAAAVGELPHGGFVAWCANEHSDPRHLPGAGEAVIIERPLTRRALRAALLRSDGVADPSAGAGAPTLAQQLVVSASEGARPDRRAGGGRSARPPRARGSTPEQTGHGLRVLLVTENPVDHLVAGRMLDDLGCSVEVAEGGGQAVELYDTRRHDLVLMDLRMHDLDGAAATAAMRASAVGSRRTPIIALVCAAQESERAEAIAGGMDDVLTKPICADALSRVVARWSETPSLRGRRAS